MVRKLFNYATSKRVISAFVALILLFQLFLVPEMVSHGAENINISFNGKNVPISVKGYTGSSGGKYTFSSRLTFEFTNPDSTQFNRYTLNYTADSCIEGTIYYSIFGAAKRENFFLESGANVSFSSLIDGYLDSKKGSHIEKIVFKPLSSATAKLTVNSIKTVTYAVYEDQTAYIENERFKLGCYLIWGGGLNYIEDKKDNDSTVSNMLNHCDTGRLVQQSYYGTMDSPYLPGSYNGSTWAYNPVQGGDQYGNKSKLVDFVVSSDAIYVKCRPLDWSKNNVSTFAYMENVYTLENDHIKVDNRFIDFSGYDHGGGKHQELPAFYTISYLDTFTFYNGKKPWTNDTLTVKKNLPFWGNSSTSSQCYFGMENENTETWCAWTSKDKGYGLGIYTPEASMLLAGRYSYNGSKNPKDNPTNYVAPLITSRMQNYEPFQYSYYITAGTVNSIRSVFKKTYEVQTSVSDSLDKTNLSFDNAEEIKAFLTRKDVMITHDKLTGSAVFTSQTPYLEGGCDTYAYLNFSNVNTKNSRYLVLTYKVDAGPSWYDSYTAEFFVCTGERIEAEGGYSYRESLADDSKFHSLVIDMWNIRGENGSMLWPSSGAMLNAVRLDFDGSSAGDRLYIAGFALASSASEANELGNKFKSSASSPVTSGNGFTAGTNIVIPSASGDDTQKVPNGSNNNENSSNDSSNNSGVGNNPTNNSNGNNNYGNSNNGSSGGNDLSNNGNTDGDNSNNGSNSFDGNDSNNNYNSDENSGINDREDNDVNIILVVVISALSGAFLVVIVVVTVLLVKKKKKQKAKTPENGEAVPDDATALNDNSPTQSAEQSLENDNIAKD